jgi:competence protein ComEA
MFQSIRRALLGASFLVLSAFAGTALAAVEVNKADQATLETVKGIGPGLSTKLLDERKKGAFKDWGDLIERVKGIGPGNAARFSTEGLTVNNTAYAAAPKAEKAEKADKAMKAKLSDKASPAAK